MRRGMWCAILVGAVSGWVVTFVADIWLSGGQALTVGWVAAVVDMLLFAAAYDAVTSHRRRDG